MIAITGLLIAPGILLAAIGLGAAIALLLRADLPVGATGIAICGSIGLVCLGWIGFLLMLTGLTGFTAVLTPVVAGIAAVWIFRRRLIYDMVREMAGNRAVVIAAAILCGVDVLASTMPVIDADSNAYHFTLPLQFLVRGELFLIPRAVDGAAPLLFQTIYAFGLKLGGESSMLLLAKLIVWMLGLLVYGVLRPQTGRLTAALMALLMMTMPAVVYGMGAGQVEARIALLTLAGAAAIWTVWLSPSAGNAAIAGLLFGGVAAAKFTGLLFVPAAALMLLLATRNPRHILAFALAGLIAGSQWYIWLWVETGSPVFPMFAGPPFWHPENQAAFASRLLSHERVIPADIVGLISYPFHAFFATHPGLEAGRTGAGPAILALFPIALAGAWRLLNERRDQILRSDTLRLLAVLFGCAVIFYILWWYIGASQRVRHLLPAISLLFVAFGLCISKLRQTTCTRLVVTVLLLALSAVQLGGWAFYHRNTLNYAVTGFDHEATLARDLLDHEAIRWMQRNLPASSLLVLLDRQNNYYLDLPFYRVSSDLERLVGVGEPNRDPAKFVREIRTVGGTHILFHLRDNPAYAFRPENGGFRLELYEDVENLGVEGNGVGRFHQLVLQTLRDGCATIVHMSRTRRVSSRTLAQAEARDEMVIVVALESAGCPYADSLDQQPIYRRHTDWLDGRRRAIPGR
jgi:4-amino-4-deoxy-L-arabinose transferase-like glycosyltransferase